MKKVLSIIFTAMLALGASAQNTHDIVIWHGTKSVGHLQYWCKKS